MAYGNVDENTVHMCTGKPLRSDISAIAKFLLNTSYQEAFESMYPPQSADIWIPETHWLGDRNQGNSNYEGNCFVWYFAPVAFDFYPSEGAQIKEQVISPPTVGGYWIPAIFGRRRGLAVRSVSGRVSNCTQFGGGLIHLKTKTVFMTTCDRVALSSTWFDQILSSAIHSAGSLKYLEPGSRWVITNRESWIPTQTSRRNVNSEWDAQSAVKMRSLKWATKLLP